MKKIKDNELINVDKECESLVDFTIEKWEGMSSEKIKELIEFSFHEGLQAGKYWIDDYGFNDVFDDWNKSRENPESWDIREDKDIYLKFLVSHDSIYNFGYGLISGATSYKKIVMKDWNYSSICNKVAKEVLTLIPEAKKFKPKGWDELKVGYSDFDGFDSYQKEHSKNDMKIFNGVNSSTAGASGFHERIALPNVMYDDVCQGRNPLRTISSSAVAHGLFVASHNNTANIINEMERLKKEMFIPENFKQMVYIEKASSIPNDKILQAIFLTKEEKDKKYYVAVKNEYQDQDGLEKYLISYVDKYKNTKPLSEEEKKIRDKKDIEEMMASFAKDDTKEQKKIEAIEEKRIHKLIFDFLETKNKKSNKP